MLARHAADAAAAMSSAARISGATRGGNGGSLPVVAMCNGIGSMQVGTSVVLLVANNARLACETAGQAD